MRRRAEAYFGQFRPSSRRAYSRRHHTRPTIAQRDFVLAEIHSTKHRSAHDARARLERADRRVVGIHLSLRTCFDRKIFSRSKRHSLAAARESYRQNRCVSQCCLSRWYRRRKCRGRASLMVLASFGRCRRSNDHSHDALQHQTGNADHERPEPARDGADHRDREPSWRLGRE